MRLASGTAVNSAIIAGQVDVAMAGATVLLNLWDRTIGRNTVKGMMAIADTWLVRAVKSGPYTPFSEKS